MLRDSRGVVITRRGHSTAMPNSSMTSGVAWKEPIASRSDGLLDLGTIDWLGQEAPAIAVLPTTGDHKRKPDGGRAGVPSFPVRCLLLLQLHCSVGFQLFQRSQGGYRGLLGVGHRAGHDGGGPRQLFAVFQQVTPSLGAGQGPVHRAVSVPPARVTLTDDGVAGG